jgi:hypothetical protein
MYNYDRKWVQKSREAAARTCISEAICHLAIAAGTKLSPAVHQASIGLVIGVVRGLVNSLAEGLIVLADLPPVEGPE